MKEKRNFTRIEFDAIATLSVGDGYWDTKVLDISLKGALISAPDEAQLATGQQVELNLTLSDNTTHILMKGKLSHHHAGRIGVVCEHIDVESASHLRRIVELNTGDESLLEREFEALSHFND